MNTEFEKKIKGLNNFNNNEIKIIKSLEKKTQRPLEALKEILNNYDKTEGELLSFEHTLTIECIPSEEVYEYIIGKKIFEYSEGDSSFTFDNYW